MVDCVSQLERNGTKRNVFFGTFLRFLFSYFFPRDSGSLRFFSYDFWYFKGSRVSG